MRNHLAGFVVLVTALVGAVVVGGTIAANANVDEDFAAAAAATENFEVAKAVSIYTKLIESGGLSQQDLVVAYLGRGYARDLYAGAFGLQDSEMVLALRDYQKSSEIMPNGLGYLSEGGALIALGSYSDASAAYRRAIPFEAPTQHWSLIGLARVERVQKRYDAALKHLDTLVEMWKSEGGTMPIHYHRGRVLYLMERFAQAAEAFSNGMPKQPDYAYAYHFRACAYARLGEFPKAIADEERALLLMKAPPINEAWERSPAAKAAHQDMNASYAAIKAMAAGAATESDRANLCVESWNDGERLRTRSPLLSPQVAQGAPRAGGAQLSATQPQLQGRFGRGRANAARQCQRNSGDCLGD